jgi:transposase
VEADGREALGRSRGGLTSKIHLLADDRARQLTWQTTPGQRGDSPMFVPVLEGLRIGRRGRGRPRTRPGRLRGDKAYSSGGNRAYLRRRHIKATIAQPDDQRASRQRRGPAGGRPPAFDKAQYRRRSAAERCVNKWKQYRAVATRYDKRDYIFNGTLTATAIIIWLRDIVQEPSDALVLGGLDEVGCFFRDHDDRGVGVPPDQGRHDRCVCHVQAVQAEHRPVAVHHGADGAGRGEAELGPDGPAGVREEAGVGVGGGRVEADLAPASITDT